VTKRRREVARGLVFDARDRLLLIRWREPDGKRVFWEPPGGERKKGESFEAALRREIAEETGVADIEIGRCLRELDRRFVWAGREFDCVERYFWCRLAGRGRVAQQLEAVEQIGFVEARWLSRAFLETVPDELEPPELLDMLGLAGGNPSAR